MNIDSDKLKQWLPWVLVAFVVLASAGRSPTVTNGPKVVLLVRETSQVTPTMANTETLLRSGPAADYLDAKKHNLLILSDDQPLPNGSSEGAKAGFEQAKALIPAVAVIAADKTATKPLGVEKINPDASPDDVLAVVKKYGG